jgi:hypothetical protein
MRSISCCATAKPLLRDVLHRFGAQQCPHGAHGADAGSLGSTNECWIELKTILAKSRPRTDLPEILDTIKRVPA